jgi:hypothetical protein
MASSMVPQSTRIPNQFQQTVRAQGERVCNLARHALRAILRPPLWRHKTAAAFIISPRFEPPHGARLRPQSQQSASITRRRGRLLLWRGVVLLDHEMDGHGF